MGLNADMIAVLIEKGLNAEDILDVARAAERKVDPTANERQRRKRAKDKEAKECHAVTVTRDTKPLDKKAPQTPEKINPKDPPIVPPFHEKFVAVWNEAAKRTGLPKAIPLTAERKAKLKRRVAEFGEDGMLTAVTNLAASPFHCGENDRGWRADIGWLLKSSENVTKALELTARGPPGKPLNDFLASILERKRLDQLSETAQ